jgi:hypothetical protein
MKLSDYLNPFDLITIGLGGFVSAGLIVYALVAGIDTPNAKEGLCLLGAVSLATFVGYAKYRYDYNKNRKV